MIPFHDDVRDHLAKFLLDRHRMFSFLKPKPSASASRAAPKDKRVPSVHVGGVNTGAQGARRPPPMFAPASPDVWKKQRKLPGATETRVSDAAMAWMQSLPKAHRPMRTCQAYPHVVNHLCGWWDNPDALASYFDDLLNSSRQNRQGFPAPIKTEIETLLTFARLRGLVVKAD